MIYAAMCLVLFGITYMYMSSETASVPDKKEGKKE